MDFQKKNDFENTRLSQRLYIAPLRIGGLKMTSHTLDNILNIFFEHGLTTSSNR